MKIEHLENIFFINRKPLFFYKEYKKLSIIQLCDALKIVIPRFCYHPSLSIAGNCRMCLVEIVQSPKPVIACATGLMDKMEILTKSHLVSKLREDILEFLLINHPLDCPICDQGGECDLQEQTYSFGSDRSRFKEMKRSVEDKELGPVIKTIMTRCIHCTRCIRFSDEYLGVHDLGIFGRGSESEIKVNKINLLNSELSGNLVDVCPVGALTSKPLSFTCRPWELKSIEAIDTMDSLNSSIKVDVKGNRIFRILPRKNERLNQEWISDFTRFSYESFEAMRLQHPHLLLTQKELKSFFSGFSFKKDSYFKLSWAQCIEFSKVLTLRKKFDIINFFSGSGLGIKNISLFYFLSKYIKNSFHSIEGFINSEIDNRSSFYINSFNDFKQDNIFLIYDLNFKANYSVFNSRLYNFFRTTVNKKIFYYIGKNIQHTYSVKHIGNSLLNLVSFLRGKHLNIFAINTLAKKNFNVNLLSSSVSFDGFLNDLKIFDSVQINNFNFFSNVMGYFECGINTNLLENTSPSNSNDLSIYLRTHRLLPNAAFSLYSGYYMPTDIRDYLFLPTLTNFEQKGTYINIYGDLQDSVSVLNKPAGTQAKHDFYILKNIIFNFILHNADKNQLTSFASFDLLLNEISTYYLNYFVLNLNLIPFQKNLNYKSLFIKKKNHYYFDNTMSNLIVKDTFMVSYSHTLRDFYKQQNNITKSSFF